MAVAGFSRSVGQHSNHCTPGLDRETVFESVIASISVQSVIRPLWRLREPVTIAPDLRVGVFAPNDKVANKTR